MKKNLSKTYENVEIAIICILFSAASVTVVFFIVNTISIIKKGISLCFTNSCIGNFFSLYENIFKIPVIALALVTALLGWITVRIYLNTYFTAHENNLNTQEVNRYSTYLNHYKYFCEVIDTYLEHNKFINKNDIDKFIFYAFVFSKSQNGSFEISEPYKTLINKLNLKVKDINSNLPRKIGYVDHRDYVIQELSHIGIKLPKCDRKDFVKLEYETYKILNKINKNIGIKEIDMPTYTSYSS